MYRTTIQTQRNMQIQPAKTCNFKKVLHKNVMRYVMSVMFKKKAHREVERKVVERYVAQALTGMSMVRTR